MSVGTEKTKTISCKGCGKAVTLHWKVQPPGPLLGDDDIGERLSCLVKYCDPCGDFFWGLREFRRQLSDITTRIIRNPETGERYRKRLESMTAKLANLVAARFRCRLISASHLVDIIIKTPEKSFEALKEYMEDIQSNMEHSRPRTNDD